MPQEHENLKSDDPAAVMVVDDMPDNLNLLSDVLQEYGYRVQAFPSGPLALRAAARKPPDIILLDITMPGMDGFEVCRQLKENPALVDIPVLFVSAMDDTGHKVKAFSAGGVDYVTKPFNFEEIRARIGTHLKIRRMQLELEQHNRHLEELVEQKVDEISHAQMATILALSQLAESRDKETGNHILRTQTCCRQLAAELRRRAEFASVIDDRFIENIYHAAPLHDIGKVGISDSILLKPGPLTPEEFEVMKTHVRLGVNTLRMVEQQHPGNSFIGMGIDITRSHHERWDGTGYPEGLRGEAIPLAGRIMAIADVYDALRSERPYKLPFSHERSIELIVKGSGTQFDPDVVEAFLRIGRECPDRMPFSAW